MACHYTLAILTSAGSMEEGEGSGRDKQVGGIGNAFFEFKVPRKYSDGGGGGGSGPSLDEVIEFCRFLVA